jgi:ubiquinone biosynthesis protein UbiJ
VDHTIIQAGLAAAETAINKALKFDPATQAKLQALSEKVLGLNFINPSFSIYIRFVNGIQLISHYEGEPEA